jgi:hypothetical protein
VKEIYGMLGLSQSVTSQSPVQQQQQQQQQPSLLVPSKLG